MDIANKLEKLFLIIFIFIIGFYIGQWKKEQDLIHYLNTNPSYKTKEGKLMCVFKSNETELTYVPKKSSKPSQEKSQ